MHNHEHCELIFCGTLCHLIFLSSYVIGEKKKNKAQVELLQLRIPPDPKKKNLLKQNKDPKERLIHCLYSKISV